MTFDILPSIDLRAGKVVDLYQGDFNRETVYGGGAADWARRFLDAGAAWIHIVDLDGSRDGTRANRPLVEEVARVARDRGAGIELGGGIRSIETIRAALESGVTRVVIGTAAVEHPDLVSQAVAAFGAEAIVVGIDSRDGYVTTRGWTERASLRAADMARQMVERGAVRFVCTDVARDSTLSGPNFEALEEIAAASSARLIASGGVTTVEQIEQLRALALEGAIVGSALYAGRLRLEDALQAARKELASC